MSEHLTIDRDTYRKIKKMSREELQDFLSRYANNLLEDSPTIDLSALHGAKVGLKVLVKNVSKKL